MELAKVEALLERYFEGQSSLKEEQVLQNYFSGDQVDQKLEPYTALFKGFAGLRAETGSKTIALEPAAPTKTNIWRYAVAALVVVALSIGYFLNTGQGLTPEQQQALAAFEETKKALQMISGNLNTGIEGMAHLNELTEATNQIFK